MSGGTEEYPDLGRHCEHPDCHQLDFLPFTCNGCQQVFCLEHRTYKSHQCPKSDHGSRKVSLCERCSLAIETTGKYGEDEKKIMREHEKSKDCDPAKYKPPRCPVRRCKEILTFSNNATCKSCQIKVCLNHRFPADHACERLNMRPNGPSVKSKLVDALSQRKGTDCSKDNGGKQSPPPKTLRSVEAF
ncbi:Zinc finger AN1 domain-containing stress-associated protein 12-like protein [Drosera capensis]